MTLRCVPAFVLDRVDRPLPRDEVLDSFDERAAEHDHFELCPEVEPAPKALR